ncbi:hypothetical protein JOD24_003179 [Kroppenstedtia sanguinis]|uniref:hypothetical protein n=1 Tax=Kroppenstedtia sanguinis TaxID=1380684 RepID=UPI003D1A8B54
MVMIVISLMVVGLIGVYLTIYFSTPMTTKIVKAKLLNVESDEEQDYWVEQYSLTPKQATDIVDHPGDYKRIMYICELNNDSNIIDLIDIRTKPDFSNEIEKRALYSSKEFENYQIQPGQRYWEGIEVLVKMEEGDTPEKLLDMAKQDRFTISGRKYLFLSDTPTNAPLTQFPMGSFSLEAKYEGE